MCEVLSDVDTMLSMTTHGSARLSLSSATTFADSQNLFDASIAFSDIGFKEVPSVMEECESLGSKYHHAGDCKPCRWFHRPGGCGHGQNCEHCHMCPAGEHKRRARVAAENRK